MIIHTQYISEDLPPITTFSDHNKVVDRDIIELNRAKNKVGWEFYPRCITSRSGYFFRYLRAVPEKERSFGLN